MGLEVKTKNRKTAGNWVSEVAQSMYIYIHNIYVCVTKPENLSSIPGALESI